MGTRTVRLDPEAEELLGEIMKLTGMTISAALKEGLVHLRARLRLDPSTRSWDLYESLDLGPGGYSVSPSTETREGVTRALKKKHKR
jgi:hypothetical protein